MGIWARLRGGIVGQPMTCDDCDSPIKVTIEPYGAGRMAVFNCKECGVSYDTNVD